MARSSQSKDTPTVSVETLLNLLGKGLESQKFDLMTRRGHVIEGTPRGVVLPLIKHLQSIGVVVTGA